MIEYRGIHKSGALRGIPGRAPPQSGPAGERVRLSGSGKGWAVEAVVGGPDEGHALIDVRGDGAALVDRLRAPLLEALSGRGCVYTVRVAALGPGGDVLVSITASKGSVPLLFTRDELQPVHVSRVVRGALDRAAL
jgi:hypothetical protein